MDAQDTRFNRILLVALVGLYLVSIGWFTYANWRVEAQHVLWMIVVNALILSIPLVLGYAAIYLLVTAYRRRKMAGQLTPRQAKIIFWAPRAAAIAITFFVSLFSLDVFGSGTLLEQFGAFLMHNIPTFAMILVLVFAWRRPVIGFVAFLAAGVFFLRFVILGGDLGNFLLFSGPMLLVAGLFYADWRWNQPAPPPAGPAGEA